MRKFWYPAEVVGVSEGTSGFPGVQAGGVLVTINASVGAYSWSGINATFPSLVIINCGTGNYSWVGISTVPTGPPPSSGGGAYLTEEIDEEHPVRKHLQEKLKQKQKKKQEVLVINARVGKIVLPPLPAFPPKKMFVLPEKFQAPEDEEALMYLLAMLLDE